MTWEIWTLFVITETILCLTPGPAVLFVVGQGASRGIGAALATSVGILAGNALYFLLSATGLGALLMASYDLFAALRWLGAGYLVWLGVGLLRAPAPGPAHLPRGGAVSARRLVLRGFLVQAANPKALVFFTALLPQFIDPRGSVTVQVAILALTSFAVEMAVLAIYGVLAARATHLAASPGPVSWTRRTGGGLLVLAGLRMAALRRAD